ncbi:MAG: glycosyltransferase [Anaerolineae bacterium]|nr:glycosyltransferase [Anaerolineae bacterium]
MKPKLKLLYLANARLPTEKAHGGQIMQMCAALAGAGAEIELWHARRANTPELAGRDPFDYYRVARTFTRRAIPCVDLFAMATRLRNRWGSDRAAFLVQAVTYALALGWRLRRAPFDALYTRDPITLLALRLGGLGARTFYEAHRFPGTAGGARLHRFALRGVGGVVTLTARLRELYAAQNVPAARLHVAHDAVDLARFAALPDKREARRTLGLPGDAFIAGYVGRFHTMGMAKGLDTLVEAAARTGHVHVCLVGGPAETVEALRARGGLDSARLHDTGQVPPAEVPRCLAAFDVCVMPFPWTEHFAYYASPIKLFEYMASGRPIVASDLPAVREVVAHEVSALLTPPGDPDALAKALRRLSGDPALGARLAANARALAEKEHTWEKRAGDILAFIRQNLPPGHEGAPPCE